jgi:HPt (histidine-containing phosphotransfer) domain-containing protein
MEHGFIVSTLALEDPTLVDLVEECLRMLPAQVAELGQALERGDAAAVARIGHALKGSCGSYGFASVSQAAAAVERCARAGDLAGAAAHVSALGALLPRLRAAP